MPDLDILRELVQEDSLVSAESDVNGRRVLILEENKAQPAYAITIFNVPYDAVAVKVDDFPPPAFKGSRGERKRADFVIFAQTPEQNWIVYMEMKGGRVRSEKDVVHQLMGAQCVVSYCRAVGRVFWDRGANFLEEHEYQQRFVSVKEIGMNKRPTWGTNRNGRHDTARNMRKIVAPGNGRIRFQRLIDG